MGQITHWLVAKKEHYHKKHGIRSNLDFCKEVVEDINKDESREAFIEWKGSRVAVFSKRKIKEN